MIMGDLDITNTHLLLVEDNEDYLELLVEELQELGYTSIVTAFNPSQAKEKLDQQVFEVIVADMRLEGDSGGGFVVFEEVRQRNISAVVIILTANDTVVDCRKAHKLGAWDYIPKNMFEGENPFHELHQSIQEAITYFNRWGSHKDQQWLAENREALQLQYANQYVAIINQSVIESAPTEEALKVKIKQRKLPLYLPIIEKFESVKLNLKDIQQLLQREESHILEFKESFYYDSDKENFKNKVLRFNNLKTIVAFLNSQGGTLLIGVTNDKTIYGLENDLSLLGQKKNQDGFELMLTELIKTHIGAAFVQFINVDFIEIEQRLICAVVVKKSTQVAFLKEGNKTKLYIRTGNSSQLLDDAEQICKHLQMLNGASDDDQ